MTKTDWTSSPRAEIRVAGSSADLVDQGANLIAEQARGAIAQNGRFSIALSGGSTPAPIYAKLAAEPFRSSIDWSKVSVYFGDERCVPPDSDQSNYRMARQSLLSHVPIPESNIHRMRGEDDPQTAAIAYGKLLKEHFGDSGLDLILLGMGPDGHTASLFPHTVALAETHHRCVANYVPQMLTWRVTMTAPFINRAKIVTFIVQGVDKADRIQQVITGPRNEQTLPSQLIVPNSGRLIWLLDVAAASKLTGGK
jgi:6-phosphogluconolactonase